MIPSAENSSANGIRNIPAAKYLRHHGPGMDGIALTAWTFQVACCEVKMRRDSAQQIIHRQSSIAGAVKGRRCCENVEALNFNLMLAHFTCAYSRKPVLLSRHATKSLFPDSVANPTPPALTADNAVAYAMLCSRGAEVTARPSSALHCADGFEQFAASMRLIQFVADLLFR